jgi:hypothetical protein
MEAQQRGETMIAIVPGDLVRQATTGRFGEVRSTARIDGAETATVIFDRTRETVPVGELRYAGHLATPKHQLKGL